MELYSISYERSNWKLVLKFFFAIKCNKKKIPKRKAACWMSNAVWTQKLVRTKVGMNVLDAFFLNMCLFIQIWQENLKLLNSAPVDTHLASLFIKIAVSNRILIRVLSKWSNSNKTNIWIAKMLPKTGFVDCNKNLHLPIRNTPSLLRHQ